MYFTLPRGQLLLRLGGPRDPKADQGGERCIGRLHEDSPEPVGVRPPFSDLPAETRDGAHGDQNRVARACRNRLRNIGVRIVVTTRCAQGGDSSRNRRQSSRFDSARSLAARLARALAQSRRHLSPSREVPASRETLRARRGSRSLLGQGRARPKLVVDRPRSRTSARAEWASSPRKNSQGVSRVSRSRAVRVRSAAAKRRSPTYAVAEFSCA